MEDTCQPSIIADILVAILLASIGILLVIYLINSTPNRRCCNFSASVGIL